MALFTVDQTLKYHLVIMKIPYMVLERSQIIRRKSACITEFKEADGKDPGWLRAIWFPLLSASATA